MTPLREWHRDAWFLIAALAIIAVFMATFTVWPFAPMSSLAVVAAMLRGALVVMTGFAVVAGNLSYLKRAGLSMASVGMFMTTQSLLNPHTPWEAWASVIAAGGWLTYVSAEFGPMMWSRIAKK